MSKGNPHRPRHGARPAVKSARAPGNMCLGKIAYVDKAAAELVVQSMLADGIFQRSYRCPVCTKHHTTCKPWHPPANAPTKEEP